MEIKNGCDDKESKNIRFPSGGEKAQSSNEKSDSFKEVHRTDEITFNRHGYKDGCEIPSRTEKAT